MPLADVVRCIWLAFLIDVYIAQWCGSLDLLFSHTLRNEAESWEGIAQQIDELVEEFQHEESTSRNSHDHFNRRGHSSIRSCAYGAGGIPNRKNSGMNHQGLRSSPLGLSEFMREVSR